MAADPGFGPGRTPPEGVVIPFHQSAISEIAAL